MQGIVVTTSESTKDYLSECLASLPTEYEILVVSNNFIPTVPEKTKLVINNWNGWELGGIYRGKQTFSEFIHIMDSTLIKDKTLFSKLFNIEGNVFLTEGGYHYMGKFVSSLLPDIPKIETKDQAIAYELHWLPKPYLYFEPNLPVHTDIFEEKFGQKRMKLENDYMVKWKGTYFI